MTITGCFYSRLIVSRFLFVNHSVSRSWAAPECAVTQATDFPGVSHSVFDCCLESLWTFAALLQHNSISIGQMLPLQCDIHITFMYSIHVTSSTPCSTSNYVISDTFMLRQFGNKNQMRWNSVYLCRAVPFKIKISQRTVCFVVCTQVVQKSYANTRVQQKPIHLHILDLKCVPLLCGPHFYLYALM